MDVSELRNTITKLRAENRELKNNSQVIKAGSTTFLTGVESGNKEKEVSKSMELMSEENLMLKLSP